MQILLCLLTVVLVVTLSQIANSDQIVFAENVDRFWAVLTGSKQTPSVNTDAVGFVALKFAEDFSKLVYSVNVNNVKNVTGVYIFYGNNSDDKNVVLELTDGRRELKPHANILTNITDEGGITGTLSSGAVNASDLKGELKGKLLSDLYKLVTDGRLFVNIHTKDTLMVKLQEIRLLQLTEYFRIYPIFVGHDISY